MSAANFDIEWFSPIPPEASPNYSGLDQSITELPLGHKRHEDSRPLDVPMIYERDHALRLRDGVKIYADIYRPVHTAVFPAILSWGPYGKSGSGLLNLDAFPFRAGVPKSKLSGYEDFEGLDPAEWVQKGYVIVNIDPRGVGDSEGNMRLFGMGDGQDGYDAIEEIAKLPWCNGKVAMAGNSWLAISQWFIAAERPPSLCCIAPLEGMSDILREQLCRGGVQESQFASAIRLVVNGRNKAEDAAAMLIKYPFANSYWDDKRARLDQIQVPAYIAASYSTILHTVGSFRAYEEIPHEKKWLVVHGTQEWHDLYSAERIAELHKFFDYYTKGVENGWEATPRVRVTILPFNKPAWSGVAFAEPYWPHCKTITKRLYLGSGCVLLEEKPKMTGEVTYQADASPILQQDSDPGESCFSFTFSERTVILGPSRAVLHIKPLKQDDLDVYVQLRKADMSGKLLQNLNMSLDTLGAESISEVPIISPLRYLGPQGILRASCREVAEEWSKPHWKTLSHRTKCLVKIDEPLKLEIDIWPTGIVFEAGERLVMKVSGHSMNPVDFEFLQGAFPVENRGGHTILLGGSFNSFLDIPVVDIAGTVSADNTA